MTEITSDNYEQVFIDAYKGDSPEGRKRLEDGLLLSILRQLGRKDITFAQFQEAEVGINELIAKARSSVEGIPLSA